MKKIKLTLLILSVISSTFSRAQDVYWNQFRGPNSCGVAANSEKPPIKFGEDENLLWKIELPNGSSSPVIWEDKIYLTAFVVEKKELQTICIDKASGRVLWTDSVIPGNFEKNHAISSPAQATVTVDDTGVFSYFASSGIKYFDHDGNLQWEFPLAIKGRVLYGHPSSPVIIDNKLIVSVDYGGKKKRCLLALNKNTGETIWKSMTGENTPIVHHGFPGYSTPVRFGNQIIVHRAGGIASYSLSDGTPIWWFPVLTNGVGTPVVKNNIVYTGAWSEFSEEERRGEYFEYESFELLLNDFDTNRNKLIEADEIPDTMMVFTRPEIGDIKDSQVSVKKAFKYMDKDKNNSIDKTEWDNIFKKYSQYVTDLGFLALPTNKTGELTEDDVIWMHDQKNPEVPSPLLYKSCIYFIKNGGWVTCADAKTGKTYYQEKLGPPGACIASPILANDHIYLSAYNGRIMVIKTGKKPHIISETRLEGKITATPAISSNKLYVRTSQYLYAFGQ